jgi:hypothetical protein
MSFPAAAILLAGITIMFIVELLRWLRPGGLVERIPRRKRIALPILLSAVPGVLWFLLGDVTCLEAFHVSLFAAATAVFAHELVIEAILGHAGTRGEFLPGPDLTGRP